MMRSQESGSSVFFQSQDSSGSSGSRGHQDGGLPSEHSTEFLEAKEDLSGDQDGGRWSEVIGHSPKSSLKLSQPARLLDLH